MRRTLTHIKIHQFVTFRIHLISTAADSVINVCFMGEAGFCFLGFFSVSSSVNCSSQRFQDLGQVYVPNPKFFPGQSCSKPAANQFPVTAGEAGPVEVR